MNSIAGIRKEYKLQTLDIEDVDADPIKQFEKWWQQSLDSMIQEVNAMTIATVDAHGKPAARIVLLKGFDENGFVFFTNYESAKASAIEVNANVALVFFWKELERQVRIEGIAKKTTAEESDIYFNSRPVNSKIGAWASPQSKVIASREVIEKNVAELEIKFEGKEIARPPHWGGYIVSPDLIEFWQGRPGRLHDRISYKLSGNDVWVIQRLAP